MGKRRRTRTPVVEDLLGPLESACMHAVWESSPATVADVLDRINDVHEPPYAYTTIMTVCARLTEKGLLTRRREGRGYVYEASYTPDGLVEHLGGQEIDRVVERYGQVALAQFARRLRDADPELLRRLTDLAGENSAR